jgi:hypothetical protein
MLGEISFAGKKAFNIKCDETKRRILEDLQSRFGVKILSKHHDAFHAGMVQRLNDNPHLMCIRSNGNPYLLFLTRLNFVNQCIFIDKKIQQGYSLPRMIVVRLSFADELFEGTLMEGEMINPDAKPQGPPAGLAGLAGQAGQGRAGGGGGDWLFMFSDLIACEGAHLQNHNTVRRLNTLYSLLSSKYVREPCDVCEFQVKQYFTYDQFNTMLVDFIPSLPYTCRGIYFKPLFLRFRDVLLNFDDSLVVLTYRQKFKDTVSSNFLLASDIVPDRSGSSDGGSSDGGSSSDGRSSNKSSDGGGRVTHALAPRTKTKTKEQIFSVGRTSTPDVYTLSAIGRGGEASAQIARIPDLATSKALRHMFLGTTMQTKMDVRCRFCDQFKKWIPIPIPIPIPHPKSDE